MKNDYLCYFTRNFSNKRRLSAPVAYEFGDVFKDLKAAQEDTQANFKFGDVFKDLKQYTPPSY